MATGLFGGIGGIGAGWSGGGVGTGGAGDGPGGCGMVGSANADPDARLGAMIAFSTFAEPQTGHVTSARFACLS